ncbi:MAG: response regulator, partial [Nitrospirota bacterium]
MASHLLIVDDEPAILDTLSGILQDEGYEVTSARDGQEALKLVKADPAPDLVL